MKYVLDTTAFCALMRRDAGMLALLKKNRPGNIVTVPPVVAEIAYGLSRLKPGSKKHLLLKSEKERILTVVSVVPWTSESSEHFGAIKAGLERRGRLIEDFDIAIAAIALSHGCAVLTRNTDHFNRVDGLEVLGW